jgi:hypothetical protein
MSGAWKTVRIIAVALGFLGILALGILVAGRGRDDAAYQVLMACLLVLFALWVVGALVVIVWVTKTTRAAWDRCVVRPRQFCDAMQRVAVQAVKEYQEEGAPGNVEARLGVLRDMSLWDGSDEEWSVGPWESDQGIPALRVRYRSPLPSSPLYWDVTFEPHPCCAPDHAGGAGAIEQEIERATARIEERPGAEAEDEETPSNSL